MDETEFDLGGLLGGIFSEGGIQDLIEGLSGLYALETQQEEARGLGGEVAAKAEDIAKKAGEMAAFQPYTITGAPGLGDITMDTSGVTLGMTPEQQKFITDALTGAQTTLEGLLKPRAEREAEILSAVTAARQPMTDRERLELETRLAAQGRLGTQTAAFGGTPEALAMEKAIQEQRSADIFGSMTQAGEEQTRQQELLSGLLGAAYTPQSQALELLAGGIDPAKLAQSGRLSASEALQAAISPIAQATTEGEKIAMGYTTPLIQAYTGLLAPTLQAGASAIGAEDIATQAGQYFQKAVEDLYTSIFG